MNLQPLDDHIIVQPFETESMTASGILIPDTARKQSHEGVVLAVGPGRWDDQGRLIPMSVKKGQTVLVAKYAGTEAKLPDGRTVLIMHESDVLAIVTK